MQTTQRNGILLIGLLLAATNLTLQASHTRAATGAAVRLPELPRRIGEWSGQPFDFSSPDYANYADCRLGGRRYHNARGETVDLFLIGTTRFDELHMPEYCYIANGCRLLDERDETLAVAGRSIQARRLRAASASLQQDVLFWFQTGRKTRRHCALAKMAALTRLLVGRPPSR